MDGAPVPGEDHGGRRGEGEEGGPGQVFYGEIRVRQQPPRGDPEKRDAEHDASGDPNYRLHSRPRSWKLAKPTHCWLQPRFQRHISPSKPSSTIGTPRQTRSLHSLSRMPNRFMTSRSRSSPGASSRALFQTSRAALRSPVTQSTSPRWAAISASCREARARCR